MSYEKGQLSVNSQNIMPIIKKWLYSDTDIFIRELVSNATDAIRKLQKLVSLAEAEIDENETFEINVTIDKANKTLMFSDNGIGMTAEEIKKYINQIAFSGANDFIEKYNAASEQGGEIIGHFGLGFYSAFMVSDKVQIDTLSYQEGAQAVKWTSDGNEEFEIEDCDRTNRGTTITLFISEENKQFLEEYKVRSILTKYCGFMPVDIFLTVAGDNEKPLADEIVTESDETDELDEIDEQEDSDDTDKRVPINNKPLWLSDPKNVSDDDYKSFYHKTFADYADPLFWIHLNMDYPFRLKGILYFPRLNHEFESVEGQVKLYNNQVYIADNIKEVIPEFLLLLKGAIDCPDLPLNVSRSFLQNDGYAEKMSGYITKKVADKLSEIFKEDREQYNGYWKDIDPFVKYGCIKEKNFYDKVKDEILYRTSDDKYLTISEYLSANESKVGKKVYYVTDMQQQAQYIKLFNDQEVDAAVLDKRIDAPFIQYLEMYNKDVTFCRIDSELGDVLKTGEKDEGLESALTDLFKKILSKENLKCTVEPLKSEGVTAIMILSEQSRRMKEMSAMMGYTTEFMETDETLVLNKNNPIFNKLLELSTESANDDKVALICEHIYDLAMLTHKPLTTSEMTAFVERGNKLLTILAE